MGAKFENIDVLVFGIKLRNFRNISTKNEQGRKTQRQPKGVVSKSGEKDGIIFGEWSRRGSIL